MFRKRRSKGWWQDDIFGTQSKKWPKSWSKKAKRKRCAWQSNFDYLPDLDERYDLLSSAMPLIGASAGPSGQGASSYDHIKIDDSDSDDELLMGSLRGEIVGIRYYKGTVNNNEMVELVRESSNRYDCNAVRVTNVAGQQVGHIKRELAKALAFIMDFHLARVEGVVPFGSTNVYSMPVDLTFWSSSGKRTEVVNQLRKQGFILHEGVQVPSVRMGGVSLQSQRDALIQGPSRRTFLNPSQAISTPLFSHQKQALSWMVRSENSDQLPPLWQQTGSVYLNTLTSFSTKVRPASIRGGILADDMGLGKTLEIIALILTNFTNGRPLAVPVTGQIRPSQIAKNNRLNFYRQSAKEGFETGGDSKSGCVLPVMDTDLKMNAELLSEEKEWKVSVSGKPSAPKKLLLLNGDSKSCRSLSVTETECKMNAKSHTDAASSGKEVEMRNPGKPFGPKKLLLLHSVETRKTTTALEAVKVNNDAVLHQIDNKVDSSSSQTIAMSSLQCKVADSSNQLVTIERAPLKTATSGTVKVSIPHPTIAIPRPTPLIRIVGILPNSVPTLMMMSSGVLPAPTFQAERTGMPVPSINSSQIYLVKGLPCSSGTGVTLRPVLLAPTPRLPVAFLTPASQQSQISSSIQVSNGPTVLTIDTNSSSSSVISCDSNNNNNEEPVPKATSQESVLSNSLELPISSVGARPRRNIRKPACYGDYVDNDTPAKKPKKGKTASTDLKSNPELISMVSSTQPVSGGALQKVAVAQGKRPKSKQAKGDSKQIATTDVSSTPAMLVDETTFPSECVGAVSITGEPSTSMVTLPEPAAYEQTLPGDFIYIPETTTASSDSQSCFIVNEASSSSEAAVNEKAQYTVAVDSSSDDDELPDIPDIDFANLVIPADLSLFDFSKTSGRTSSKGPRATLIICPLSTLSNWLDQLEMHVDPSVMLKIYTYYGPSRTTDHASLSMHDVVLTTYQTLAADVKSNGSLQKVHWLRVVLDEGHTIRNADTLMTKAVLSLKAYRKWVVTGTPIQNAIRDLWSLMKFLNVEPFQEKQWWDRTIERPVTRGDESALKRVQCLVGSIALRRMKNQLKNGKPIVDLPKRDIFIEHIVLSDEERQLYNTMQNEGKLVVNKYVQQGTLLSHYGEVLAIMVRLRQMCCHPFLVVKAANAMKEIMEAAEAEETTGEEFRRQLIEKILMVLNSGSDEECPICLEGLKTPVITHCAHLFCRRCIEQVIQSEAPDSRCPMCRGNVSVDSLVEVPPDYDADKTKEVTLPEQQWYSSSKVDALLNALLRLRLEDKTIKSVVVSQFTSFLTLIETPLRINGFNFVRLDGSMTSKRRSAAIEAFADTDTSSPTIFLLSLKAGGVGINLTAACRVFLLDPAWNPATEEQCFDRCHRLGQTRDVIVTKFVVENSVEERMLLLQEKKRKLAAGIFGQKPSAEEKRKNRIQDIKDLVDL